MITISAVTEKRKKGQYRKNGKGKYAKKIGRQSGILMPVSSLPSNYGIGTFGKAAYEWIDFLHSAGQSFWQVLPLGPTGYADSPYQSLSAFAGNPYFIDLDLLREDGLLQPEEYQGIDWGSDKRKVDYGKIYASREDVLRKAFTRRQCGEDYDRFCRENAHWLQDYAEYMAIKTRSGLVSWENWEDDIRLRKPPAMEKYRNELAEDISFHTYIQYLFHLQWKKLKGYANAKGISIIGDIPIYVSMDSSDAWSHSELFYLDEDCKPIAVAGVPPDAFSKNGQLWGNPLYRWDVLKQDGYKWWMLRLQTNLDMYDILRIDHFRGFDSYYAIPYGAATANTGEWVEGPGYDFIKAVNVQFNRESIIAEDLGFLTVGVKELLRSSGYPGMKILQFAFDSRDESNFLPHHYYNNCVVYTGTHDNDTVLGWFKTASREDVEYAKEYLNIKAARKGNWAMIRAALASVAKLAVIPMADYLSQGMEGRINIPSTVGGNNWRWRIKPGAATPALAQKIARLTKIYGRNR